MANFKYIDDLKALSVDELSVLFLDVSRYLRNCGKEDKEARAYLKQINRVLDDKMMLDEYPDSSYL